MVLPVQQPRSAYEEDVSLKLLMTTSHAEQKTKKILALHPSLQPESIAKICDFIYSHIFSWRNTISSEKAENFCLHFPKKTTQLDFTIQAHKNQNVYIFLGKRARFVKQGNYKIVGLCIDYVNTVLRVYSKTVIDKADKKELARNEEAVNRIFSKNYEIVHMHSAAEFWDFNHKIEKHVMILDYYNELDLQKFRKTRALSRAEKYGIAVTLICGIHAMHCKRIAHQDIKPKNIFINVDANGVLEAGIGDTGLAIFVPINGKVQFQGTPIYMAPERLSGKPAKPGEVFACDMWALGSVLYKLYFEVRCPWVSYMLNYPGHILRDFHKIQEDFEKHINEQFPEPLDSNSMEHLIWEMVRPDYLERITASQAEEKVLKLAEKEQDNLSMRVSRSSPLIQHREVFPANVVMRTSM